MKSKVLRQFFALMQQRGAISKTEYEELVNSCKPRETTEQLERIILSITNK